MTTAPEWLLQMRALMGTTEVPGAGNNPRILEMRDFIAATYPDMAAYCAQYTADSIPWCGLAAAYCMAKAGIRPPFGPTDTDKFLWARSWANWGPRISAPTPGTVVVLERSGGGHVTFYESTSGSSYRCCGGNQSDSVNVSSYPKSGVVALVAPGGEPQPVTRPTLKRGSTGPDVVAVQSSLGIPADGDFGAVTESAVKGFQAAVNLSVDGVVGPATWDKLDILDERVAAGDEGLPLSTEEAIIAEALASPMINYSWTGRGKAPAAYTVGMALSYGLAVAEYLAGRPHALECGKAASTDASVDALAYYAGAFDAMKLDNSVDGLDTLRHLYVLLVGLGMRESSGRYYEGRDTTASNVTADTAEAGLFQTSWNIKSCATTLMSQLYLDYTADPNGYLEEFSQGLSPTAAGLANFGTGEGAAYQWLAKYAPVFAVAVTALGLRKRRQHWGPINRREVDLVRGVDTLLGRVQKIVTEAPSPGPEPEPELPVVTVALTVPDNVNVSVVINGEVVL